jgi:4-amino-4-deoxy-L-arabinose transferase-like glycosyltransferase
MRNKIWPWRLAAIPIMVLHVGLLMGPLWTHFVTVNEFGHLPAGLSHWQTGSFDAYRVNPPLPRMLAATFILPARPALDYSRLLDNPGYRPEWDLGYAFLDANGERYLDLFRVARATGVLWSLLGAWLIGRWARELYGEAAGCLAVMLWCLNPLVLAFAPLVAPDLPAAVAALAASYGYWHYLRWPSWQGATLSGALLGVALLTKFTLLAFYGVWPVLWLIRWWSQVRRNSTPVGAATRVAHGLVILGLSLIVVNLGYGFTDLGRPLQEFTFVSQALTGASTNAPQSTNQQPNNRFRGSLLGTIPVPLPAAYLQGIDTQRADFEGRYPSYLAGEWRSPGWWYYYLYAFAVKLPLGTLCLIIWGIGLTVWGRTEDVQWMDEATLWLPAVAILALVSSQVGYDHHLRYALPAMPFLLVSTGKLAKFLRPSYRWKGSLILLLLVWSGVSVLRVHPHYLAYFNEAAGGPNAGHRHLINSNIDWGQDLCRLKQWVDAHSDERLLGVAYYNFVTPQAVGLDFELPPITPRGLNGLRPGYYAVSVNFVCGLDFVLRDRQGRSTYIPHGAYAYFRRFRPVAKAGYSLFIYRLTDSDIEAIRNETDLPPS